MKKENKIGFLIRLTPRERELLESLSCMELRSQADIILDSLYIYEYISRNTDKKDILLEKTQKSENN
jgi:hypothetical protein